MVSSQGGDQYIWGNMPALDMLHVEKNKGPNKDRDYSLLFTGKMVTYYETSLEAKLQLRREI